MTLPAALWLTVTAILAQGAAARPADAPDANRQILVMLKMPPDHFRPGSNYAGGYGNVAMENARRRIAAAIARRHGFKLEKGWPMPLLGVDCYVMTLPGGVAPEAAATEVSGDADVAWSEPLQLYRTQGRSRADRDLNPGPILRH